MQTLPNGYHNRHSPAREDGAARAFDPHSVGVVERRSVQFEDTLYLRSGGTLNGFTIAYETYGTLNAEKTNAILICHALSGDSHVAGFYTTDPDERPGWWDEAVGPGKMFDTEQFYLICSNVIGGCQGSTGPMSIAPDGKPFGLRFPVVTVADMVMAQTYLINHLGIDRLFAVAGGSMGAMQALQWSVDYPARVENVLFIAGTPQSSAQNIAFNEIGRQAIYADPNWNNGDYYDGVPPRAGLSVARMVGHITYMSEQSLNTKFGRGLQLRSELHYRFDVPEFRIESYLKHQGEKFVARFDANTYLYITKALDYFDIADGYGSIEAALERARANFLVVSFSSDWLYTSEQALDLVMALEINQKPVDYHMVYADFGHDSFLVEVETMTALIGGFLQERWNTRHDQAFAQPMPQFTIERAPVAERIPVLPWLSL